MRAVPGFKGYYVTTCGRIFSVKSKTIKELNRRVNGAGYQTTTLYAGAKQYTIFVHKVVAITYLTKPLGDAYNQINHVNGNKVCNAVPNLEWCTAKQNSIHAYKTGLAKSNPNREEYSVKGINPKDKKDVVYFETCSAAERAMGRNPKTDKGVNRAINGLQKTAYGYIWVKIPKFSIEEKKKYDPND